MHWPAMCVPTAMAIVLPELPTTVVDGASTASAGVPPAAGGPPFGAVLEAVVPPPMVPSVAADQLLQPADPSPMAGIAGPGTPAPPAVDDALVVAAFRELNPPAAALLPLPPVTLAAAAETSVPPPAVVVSGDILPFQSAATPPATADAEPAVTTIAGKTRPETPAPDAADLALLASLIQPPVLPPTLVPMSAVLPPVPIPTVANNPVLPEATGNADPLVPTPALSTGRDRWTDPSVLGPASSTPPSTVSGVGISAAVSAPVSAAAPAVVVSTAIPAVASATALGSPIAPIGGDQPAPPDTGTTPVPTPADDSSVSDRVSLLMRDVPSETAAPIAAGPTAAQNLPADKEPVAAAASAPMHALPPRTTAGRPDRVPAGDGTDTAILAHDSMSARAPAPAPTPPPKPAADKRSADPASTAAWSPPTSEIPPPVGPAAPAPAPPSDDARRQQPDPPAAGTAGPTTVAAAPMPTGHAPAPVLPAAAAQPAAETARAAVPNPVERMLVHQVGRSLINRDAQGDRRLVIRLTPPELGTVRVEFTERDGVLSARLQTEDPAVRQALERLLPQLRDQLRGADAPLQQITIDPGSRSDQGFDGRGFDGRGGQQQRPENSGQQHRPRRGDPLFSVTGAATADPAAPPTAPRQRIAAGSTAAVDAFA